jgi:glycosyltransferase involved in cell wall biosynthesis
MASGIPCIATDVGACSEILYGAESESPNLGHSGEVISIANPAQGVEMIDHFLKDEALWRETGDIGRQRVLNNYDESMMFDSYRKLYQEGIDGGNRI